MTALIVAALMIAGAIGLGAFVGTEEDRIIRRQIRAAVRRHVERYHWAAVRMAPAPDAERYGRLVEARSKVVA